MTPTGNPPPSPAPLWLLALVTLGGTLAMHIFVPALPSAAADLGARPSAMQLTISLYIVGLAVGQLVYGPLADRFGRRPALLGGLTLYAFASMAALFATSLDQLVALRVVQAFGGCAGLVLGRAIVRDRAGPKDAARQLALMNLMVTLGPGLAPIIGGVLVSSLGWRSILVALSALGCMLLVLTWWLLPETRARSRDFDAAALARNYGLLLRSRVFLCLAVGGGCATTSMYAFIASAPFIFAGELHRPPGEVGYYLSILIGGVWLGSAVAGRLIARWPLKAVLVGANLVSVVAAAALLGSTLAGIASVPLVVTAMGLFTFGAGIASPAALTLAVSVNPTVIGSASGLYGFSQMAVGAASTAIAGMGGDPLLAAALVLAGAGLVAQAAFWWALRRT